MAAALALTAAALPVLLLPSSSSACCGGSGAVAPNDFNGDGFADLAVGAPGDDVLGLEQGSVTVIYGSASGLTNAGAQQWSQDSIGVLGVGQNEDSFGSALASGDFDGDGYADLAIGAPQESDEAYVGGAVHVLYGSQFGLTSAGNQLWTQDSPGVADLTQQGDLFGSVLTAGDLGNGGYDDLVVGIPAEGREPRGQAPIEHSGALEVLFGSADGLSSNGSQFWSQDSAGIQEEGEPLDYFATDVAIGDVTSDGHNDLVVGVPEESVGAVQQAGAVQIIHGSATGPVATGNQLLTQNSPGIAGSPEDADDFGDGLAVGDFGGTPDADLAIGAPYEDYATGQTDDGVVHVLYGSATGVSGTGSQLWSQDSAGVADTAESTEHFGLELEAGQLGKGTNDDLLIGVAERVVYELGDGMVHVLYGSSAGLSATGSQVWHPDVAGVPGQVTVAEGFGKRMSVGNFDGSAQQDLAAGSTSETIGTVEHAGAVTVVYGATNGLTPTNSQYWSQASPGIPGDPGYVDGFGRLPD